MRITSVLIAGLISFASASFASELNVLSEQINNATPSEMMKDYLRTLTQEACDRREANYELLKTPDQLREYQIKMKEFFIEQLGGFPERTPLNAQVTGQREFDDYRIEKIIYESQPKHFVTAILYLPNARPPYPAVLFPCGHSTNGKAEKNYQLACILLVKNGFAVLCYDPIDQGERYQLLKDDGTPRMGGTIGHTMTGVGSILLGRNAATFRVWDGMRGVDYLLSRSDIDPKRIGCTGNSGGGTLTSYLMALDERIACAVPSCYLTTLRNQEPQDAEQNIHAQIAFGMDHADYIMMRAPKPTLMSTATRDFFDIKGAWITFRQAKRFYTRLGFAERIDLVETDAEHGFSIQLREAMTRWMLRWLRGIDTPVTETQCPILTDEEIQVTPKGQVMLLEGARSVYDLNLDQEQKYADRRKQFWQEAGREKALQKVRDLAGIPPLGDQPTYKVVEGEGKIERDSFQGIKLMIKPEPGIVVPVLLFVKKPPVQCSTVYLYINGEGKTNDAAPGGPIEQLVDAGNHVFAVDLRGMGETARANGPNDWTKYFGSEWVNYFSAYMLDKTYVGMRARDILDCAHYLGHLKLYDTICNIHLLAIGEAGVPALHAAALEPQLFQSVTIRNSLVSWSNVVNHTITENQLLNTVHGALKYYDLPDLAASIPEGKLTIENPVDALGNPVQ